MNSVLSLSKNLFRLSSFGVKNIPKIYPNHNSIKLSFFCTNIDNKKTFEGLNQNVNVDDLTKGDPELEKKFKLLILETDVLRQDGHKVPDTYFLRNQHWEELLNKSSRSQRIKYLRFLFKLEKKKENRLVKKEKAKEERENRPEYVGDGHIRYGLNHNTFLLRIYESTINHLYNNNLVTAMKFGQKLILDCSYDPHMTPRERKNTAKQLMFLFASNRIAKDPFDLHFCNAHPESETIKHLHKHISTMYEPWFPMNVHECSYLDIFPKEQLVYLTPDCREEMTEYNPDLIYIIGGMVDKASSEPVSLAKAKKEGLKMVKLPLDRYLQWGSGSGKNLTLNGMLDILMDIKDTGDWNKALRHVPRRKIVNEDNPRSEVKNNYNYDKHSPSWARDDNWKNRRTIKKNRIKNIMNN